MKLIPVHDRSGAARAAAAWRAEHLPFTNEQRDVRAPVDPRFVNEKKEAA